MRAPAQAGGACAQWSADQCVSGADLAACLVRTSRGLGVRTGTCWAAMRIADPSNCRGLVPRGALYCVTRVLANPAPSACLWPGVRSSLTAACDWVPWEYHAAGGVQKRVSGPAAAVCRGVFTHDATRTVASLFLSEKVDAKQ